MDRYLERGKPFKKGNIPWNTIKVVHNGIEYRSMSEMARDFKTSTQLICYYLKLDKPFCGAYIDVKI